MLNISPINFYDIPFLGCFHVPLLRRAGKDTVCFSIVQLMGMRHDNAYFRMPLSLSLDKWDGGRRMWSECG